MAEIILKELGVCALVSKRETARMAEGRGGGLAASVEQEIDGRAVQRLTLFTDGERLAMPALGVGLHSSTHQVYFIPPTSTDLLGERPYLLEIDDSSNPKDER